MSWFKKPVKPVKSKRPVNSDFIHLNPIRVRGKSIIKGIPVNTHKVRDSVKGTGSKVELARQKKLEAVSGFKTDDFMRAFGRPKIVGSKGFLGYNFDTVKENGRQLRLIRIKGIAVPKLQRRQGHRISLYEELLRKLYSNFGELVKTDKNVFLQTQISSFDQGSLRSLTRKLGFSIISSEDGITVLRKKLDSIEMKKVLGKKN